MPQDSILLDLDAIKERYNLFNTTFPDEPVKNFFQFDQNATPKENLIKLSTIILNDENTTGYLFVYKSIFLEILSNWTNILSKGNSIKVLESAASIITIYPLSTSIIEEFLDRENDHFITILQNPSSQGESKLSKVLLSYYRLLYQNKEIFAKYIKPDVLYSLIANNQLNNFSTEITKYLAIKILSLYLDMGEQALNKAIKTHISSDDNLIGSYDSNLHANYKFLELNEAKRFTNFSKLPEVSECFSPSDNHLHNYFTIQSKDLNANVVSICGVLVPKINTVRDSTEYPLEYVPTDKTVSALRDLAKKLQYNDPVMLVGRAGAGKTFLINELSKYIGCHDSIVKIWVHMKVVMEIGINFYFQFAVPLLCRKGPIRLGNNFVNHHHA